MRYLYNDEGYFIGSYEEDFLTYPNSTDIEPDFEKMYSGDFIVRFDTEANKWVYEDATPEILAPIEENTDEITSEISDEITEDLNSPQAPSSTSSGSFADYMTAEMDKYLDELADQLAPRIAKILKIRRK